MDIAHVWTALATAGTFNLDWAIDPPDLQSDHDLQTAVIISLFTDGLAPADAELPDQSTSDRRGWWGDTSNDPPANIGSTLWLYSRTVWTDAVRLAIEDAARAALQWMLDDNAADDITVDATRPEMGRIDLHIVIERAGRAVFAQTFGWAWAQQFGRT